MATRRARVALGFSVHTGWAAMVAVSGPASAPAVIDRRRVDMIVKRDPQTLRFVYHAGREFELDEAKRLIRASEELSASRMKAALETVMAELGARACDVVTGSIIVSGRPLTASVAEILKSHSLVHTAEGAHFRSVVRGACEALRLRVVEIAAKELPSRAATSLGIAEASVAGRLDAVGRAAGRPWAKDHKDAFLAASIALD
jgi:hypothetical protein